MILRIWLKLFAIVLLALVPLMAAQYYMEKESIELVFNVAAKSNNLEVLESHLNLLKKLSQLDHENAAAYRAEFERAADSRNVVKDLALVRLNLIDDILMQTLRNTLLLVFGALGVTYLIARSVVGLLRRLIAENQTHSLRLERLGALESWQRVARMMVHEMRSPITPIKLVATDMETKYRVLEASAFAQYLAKGSELIRDQVTSIERLTDSLTQFAKLPEVYKKNAAIDVFLRDFRESYREYGEGLIRINLDFVESGYSAVAFDSNLLSLLLFNLLKNAAEANSRSLVEVRIRLRQKVDRTWISFANSGTVIPPAMAGDIFNMHVSSKKDSSGSNFGVGLTIAKKIALDHNGDLYLAKNNEQEGVVFELELPNR